MKQNIKPIWLNETEYPFTDRFYSFDNENIHYLDEGSGPVLLFIHGTPSWSFEWRNVIKGLKSDFRCVAPDLSGFGLSQKTGNRNYPIQRHAAMVASLLKHMNIKEYFIISHDFGGSISLKAAMSGDSSPKGILLMNTWITDPADNKEFSKSLRILKSPLLPFLYLYMNFSARFILPMAIKKSNKPRKEILRHYTSAFPDSFSRAGTLAFARSLLNEGSFFSDVRNNLSLFSGIPVRLLWGIHDSFLPASLKNDLKSVLPQLILTEADCGHFPAEEIPDIVISEIRKLTGQSRL